MKTSWRSASLVATGAALLALTTACGQDKGDQSATGQNVGNASQAQGGYGSSGSDAYGSSGDGSASPAAKAESAGQLAAWDSKKLGKVLTDSAGMTLYRFDKDTAKPPKSNCDEACLKTWPAVPASGAKAATGVDSSLLGSVTAADGTKQLTVAGWPVYRYAMDTSPGDAKGQGVGGVWYAAAPDGKKASPAAAAAPADPKGLSTRNDPKLGEIVVDKNGMTVYRFLKDSAWPIKSNCVGACATKWPAVEPVAKNDTKNIPLKGFMTFTRPDGSKQQTLNCWPVYTFSGDKKPGDTNGQGVGGTWYAASPEGKPVGAPK
ncbi:SCO0930 family lipoprotein [Streptomyces sp. NPDC046716]|uniref:SCO0930 family lipoprotein n=1 Tax=Streptomyces sp. NPDC046716 TaxID=3157093 RepID=UPI003411C029